MYFEIKIERPNEIPIRFELPYHKHNSVMHVLRSLNAKTHRIEKNPAQLFSSFGAIAVVSISISILGLVLYSFTKNEDVEIFIKELKTIYGQ